MNQDSPGSQLGTGPIVAGPIVAGPIATMPKLEQTDIQYLVYCGCGHPLHPDHLEKRRGVMMERYTCPKRRWWNHLAHPHAWLAPRDGVPD
jgi:hypothetical protein